MRLLVSHFLQAASETQCLRQLETDYFRRLDDREFDQAAEHARSAGLWRFDKRWRNVVPHGRPVWLPSMRGREKKDACISAS
jgi:hypothetical protein